MFEVFYTSSPFTETFRSQRHAGLGRPEFARAFGAHGWCFAHELLDDFRLKIHPRNLT